MNLKDLKMYRLAIFDGYGCDGYHIVNYNGTYNKDKGKIPPNAVRLGVIYKATNLFGNNGDMAYIGASTDLQKRISSHFSHSYNPNSREYDLYFHRVIRKYTKNAFMWEIVLDNIPEDQLPMFEMFYIALFGTHGEYGYNETDGGEGSKGHKTTEETKKKISIANSGENNPWFGKKRPGHSKAMSGENHPIFGKHLGEETKKRISESRMASGISAGENNPMFGKHHTKETRKKMAENHQDFKGEKHPQFGKPKSTETRNKISAALSGANSPRFGKHLSKEAREKISGENGSNAKLNWYSVTEIRRKYATGEYTQAQLSLAYGVDRTTIGKIVTNKIWKE